MAITRLSLTDFRNHHAYQMEPQRQFVVLHGPNGAGKTNILEAVSLLVPGRGLRRALYAEMASNNGAGGFTISAQTAEADIGTGTDAATPDRRKVRINGANCAINAMAEYLAIIWLTPAMDRIFADGAAARRRFLDRLVLALEPQHAEIASRYENGLRQRNRLLADAASFDASWIDAIEAGMAEAGAALNRARNQMVAGLNERLSAASAGPFMVPHLALAQAEIEDADQLHAIWAQGRMRDRGAGRTLSGPHRTDLIVTEAVQAKPAASCSTGEQKALLLSTILAHAGLVADIRGAPPVILLDEVAAHLDPQRRIALFDRLAQTGSQVWMTGTESGLFDGIGDNAQLIAVGV
jgi:DNA replication and repair protein RecF